jgi:ABC-type uncharacterized transport system fused permease/ATPase subunit
MCQALVVMATTSLLMVWVGAMTFRRNAMEGNFRRVHSRIAEFAESIAFYGGEEAEKARADREYERLERVYLVFLLAKYTMQGLALIVLTSTPFVVIQLYLEVHPIVDSQPPDRKEFLGAVGTLVAFAALLLQQPGLWGMFSPAFGLVSRIGELAAQCDAAAATDAANQSQAVRFDDSAVKVEGLTVDTPHQTQSEAPRCLFKDFSFHVSKGSSVLIMGPRYVCPPLLPPHGCSCPGCPMHACRWGTHRVLTCCTEMSVCGPQRIWQDLAAPDHRVRFPHPPISVLAQPLRCGGRCVLRGGPV